ncbi:sugar MFS transporter [Xanthomonas fragariae]
MTTPRPANLVVSIAIVGVLFFIIGFFTWINGPLITFVRLAFDLSEVNAFLVLMVFYLSYFSGTALVVDPQAHWHEKGLALSLVMMAAGAAGFGQFATQRWYPGALGGLFVIGSGLALLQTAINPYISILGPIESAARRIALMGICNKIAGILAPILIGSLVLHGIGDLSAQVASADAATKLQLLNAFAAQIHAPYLVMSGVLLLLAIGVLFSPLPELKASEANATPGSATGVQKSSIFQFPHLWLGVLCLFVYVGVEVMAGDAIGTYGHGFDLPLDSTKIFTSYTLGAMLLGYIAGLVLIPRVISQARYLSVSAVLGVLFSLGALFTHGYVSVGLVAALGFANAMMWPAIFPLAIRGLGRFTEIGSALLVMGIAGGAIIPQAFAILKQHYDFQIVFAALMVPCYLYILFYSLRGHRLGLPAQAK